MTQRLPSPFSTAESFSSDSALAPDPSGALVGQIIGGRYKVTRIVGRGGMGVVYAGEHLELGLPIAIKVLPQSFAQSPETLKRFEREARTASRIRHPNVVTVFDLGRLDSGEPYLAMELLTGQDLGETMEPGRALPLTAVVDILQPLAAALDALHQLGVVHRDIKPSNIFFSQGPGPLETLKLVDFGLAAFYSAEGDPRLTRVGGVIGTAVYMAPEAARGALVGPSGDIYSLGVVAFELLTGHPPFDGQPMAVLMDKTSGAAPTLSQLSGRPFDPRLEALVESALARRPEERPKTATAFVEGMRAVLESGGAARSDPPPAMAGTGRVGPREHRGEHEPTASRVIPKIPQRSLVPTVLALVVLAVALTSGAVWYARVQTPTTVPPAAPTPLTPVVPPAAPAAEPLPIPEATLPAEHTQPDRAHPAHVAPRVDRTTAAVVAPAIAPVVETTIAPVIDTGMPPVVETAAAPVLAPIVVPVEVSQPETAAAQEASPEAAVEATARTDALLADASRAMVRGEVPNARDLYREATLVAPGNAAAWRGLGLASERLGLVPEARRAYTRYLTLAPGARDAASVRAHLNALAP